MCPAAALYLVDIFLECLTLHALEHDAEMLRLSEHMDRVKRAHGLDDDEHWYLDEAPAEWLELNAAWDRRDHALRAAALRDLGEEEPADLLERDPEGFGNRARVGYLEFWGARAEEARDRD